MEYRFLGNSGLLVSVVSLGAWITWGVQISDDDAYECMKEAYDRGCNFFDNAEGYGSGKAEVTMGKCIKRLNVDRSSLVISTKIYFGGAGINLRGLSRKHIIEGLTASIKRMELDYVDLVFAHRPDDQTPMEEIVRAFNYCIDKGLAFYWGTSEWSSEQISKAHAVAERLGLVGPVMEQPQYNMFHRTRFESEYAGLYRDYGLGTTIWSPLASGLLTGKYGKDSFPADSRLGGEMTWLKQQLVSGDGLNGLDEKNFDTILQRLDSLKVLCGKLNCTLPQLSIAWCIKNPNVSTVITGASKPSQVVENFAALDVAHKLTPAIMDEIESILKNKPAAPRELRLAFSGSAFTSHQIKNF